VLATPLTLERALRFVPPLPDHRRLALERARYGRVVKAAAAFAGQYRAEGDPPLAELTSAGLVYEPDESRRLIGLFARSGAAGRARPPGPAVDWSREPFSLGSYLIFGPGDLLAWGRRLAEPHGRLHFAGAEASTLPSYLEGAVRAGERAAAEVAAAL
jgi:monoamine oxidase